MGKTCYLSDSERCLLCGLLRGESKGEIMASLRHIYGEIRDFDEISLTICIKLED